MIAKVPCLRLSGRIFIRAPISACVSSVSGANCIQTNPQDDQNPPDSSEFEAKVQSLKNKLHPETLMHVLSSTHNLNASLRLFKWASLQNRFRHTTDTYSHIIMRLGMACRVEEVEGFCNEMVKGGFSASEQVLLGLLDSFIRYHRLDEALRVLFVLNSSSYKLSIALVNRLLGALVKEKKGLECILFVYKEMVKASIVPTTETLNYLLEALFEADRIDAVLDQYKRMQKKGCCPNSRTFEIMVSGLIGKNLLDEALVVLNEILETECEPESQFFSHILPLLFRMNKPEVGLKLFEKMKTFKVVPDFPVYEVLIQYFSKSLCMDDAVNLLNEMIHIDLKPSDCVFVDLVDGFCMLNKLNEAKKLLEDKQVMEVNSYSALLRGYCQAGNFVEVIQLFQKMVEKNITNPSSWNIFIRYLSENGRCDIIYGVLKRMIVSTSMPDSDTYSALIVGKCKSNELDGALKLFHHVCEEHWIVDSACYATLIRSLCKLDKIQEAFEVFCYMSFNKCSLCASSFSMLIRGLYLIGKVDELIHLPPLAYYSGKSCSNSDYGIIMKSLSKLSKGNGLLVIVARMVVEGCPQDSESYNELIKSMSEHHRATECALFLDLMVNEGFVPDTEILHNSISCLAQDFRLHMVLPTIKKLFSDHDVVNPTICNILINGFWKEGYKHEAGWLLDVMLEKGWVPDATTHRLLVNSGGCEEASSDENGNTEDEIMSILSEGFSEV
ncbi:pentatricopeptide repeat-containing protein At5g46100-like [Cynara cardunculus var. scolymus]|uniref:Pentatricopeptide repeat-containing protein n=1 Tax=Cynara cardunculus var. scolymus TaxID=59895 RepID=A0A118K0N0_CYNCS|nr:pentatricopeptide repeat-containing protein At5g46100-like [Cynara cardunculus var. scolymus]XP_024959192.1 pentatricopeptide repeat-containing protein At5g46100-like [Cynara cardunculus var. scolymus]KVI01650.1 Pentatricopeptide repeat-containing protein [Cynara cardunculus var. scolymus]